MPQLHALTLGIGLETNGAGFGLVLGQKCAILGRFGPFLPLLGSHSGPPAPAADSHRGLPLGRFGLKSEI